MKWIREIKAYKPYNEQETKDKDMILRALCIFDDILFRENEFMHITCSGFILNKAKDKVLMVHHNIYNSWSWVGGHADGDDNLLQVTIREAKEETGVKNIKPISEEIFALDVLPVLSHRKKGRYVPSHLHLSITYLLEAEEDDKLVVNQEENSDVRWIPLEEVNDYCSEPHMKKVYKKLYLKIKELYDKK